MIRSGTLWAAFQALMGYSAHVHVSPPLTLSQNIFSSLTPVKRYLDTFDKAVRGINERDMFVTMAFPPDIPLTNTRDLINVVITRFTNTARFFSAVQVFLILKHFAAVFPPVLSTELKSLKSMSDQGFLSEQEYSDRRLILFDKYVPPQTRSGAAPAVVPKASSTTRATTSTRVPSSTLHDKSGDEALAEVTRMLEESMRRTSDRRSANLESAAPPAYSGEILAQSTPPPRASSTKSSGSTIGMADTSAFCDPLVILQVDAP